MAKLRIADLYCGAGGAARGLQQAGFHVTGYDIEPQPRYVGDEFHQQDALTVDLSGFDVVWASPPCQDYSKAVRHLSKPQPRLIAATLAMIASYDAMPFILENVVGAPIPEQATLDGRYGVLLCGTSFGLRIYRHRLFETSFPVERLLCNHKYPAMNPYNTLGQQRIDEEFGKTRPREKIWRDEMGVSWMERQDEWREAIPPAYSKYLGEQLKREMETT
jgi:DNA (cytosine-5)-methyltransferase 1